MARPRKRSAHRQQLLDLIIEGVHDGGALRDALGIRQRSLARLLSDLRAEGYRILAVRDGSSWSYRLEGKENTP